ncbi:MAG TPA: L-dopachrome tautomerase-related protein [Candidatus Binatia bacterium]|nr:L-dopachrome tautomerase-related protein [Candidatus Binatia bacterium]
MKRFLIWVVGILVALVLVVRIFFGGGARLDDRSTAPELPASAIEKVVDLDYPPGNVAVSADGRVFFTYHPDGGPPVHVLELRGGKPEPYPSTEQQELFETVLSLRIDRQNRLWTLDHADYGRGQPTLLAFDLASNSEVHRHEFPSEVAGLFSMLNDFQVDAAGETIYIAEASPLVHTPAVIVYDVKTRTSRRVLDSHPSVLTEDYRIQAPGRDMVVLGIFTLRIGIDSIALDRGTGEWLYYGPVTGGTMSRVRTRDLKDTSLTPAQLAERVERFAPKPISDGLSADAQGTVYVTDPEHSAVLALGQDRKLRTLVKDPRLRWPDGLSFGPDNWLYVSCSDLQDVLFVPSSRMRAAAPFQIFRFKPGGTAPAGQ